MVHCVYNVNIMFTTMKTKNYLCNLRLQEKLLANLDEDQQNDAGLAGGDEVSQTSSRFLLFPLTKSV